jgi:hypothetical protein
MDRNQPREAAAARAAADPTTCQGSQPRSGARTSSALRRVALATALSAACGLAGASAAAAAEPWGFEQVTPVNKGAGTVAATYTFQASPDGDSLLYTADSSFEAVPAEGSPKYVRYLGFRGPDSWINRALDPPHEQGTTTSPNFMSVLASSANLSYALVVSRRALTAGATEGGGNLYIRNTRTGAYQLVATSDDPRLAQSFLVPSGALGAFFVADDGRAALFSSATPLIEGVPPSDYTPIGSLYAWTADGGLELKSVLPEAEGGTPVGIFSAPGGSQQGPRDANPLGDGLAHVYFSALVITSQGLDQAAVYVNSGGDTRAVSVSRIPGDPSTPVPGVTDAVSRDGRYLLFHTYGDTRLTPDTPTLPVENYPTYLYRYDVQDDSLTYIAASGYNADATVQMSRDGQTVAVRSPVAQGGAAVEGQQNFYVWRDGELRFVATSTTSVDGDYLRLLSQSGRYFAFTDVSASLAARFGKDIVSASCPVPFVGTPGLCNQVYLYDFDADELACVSCRADGAPPMGHAGDPSMVLSGAGLGDIPMNSQQRRILAEDGTVFFGSVDDLVPTDSNGTGDVYAYRDGQLRLVSRAAQGTSARLLDATPDGKTVFIATDDPISPTDNDRSVDVYMTREGAGYPYTAPVVKPPCTGGDCRDPFAGAGGLAPIGSLAFASPDEEPARSGTTTVRVSKLRAAIGSRAVLRVRVPSAGSIRVSGRAVRSAGRRATRSATYRVEVRLSAKARKSLAKRKALRVRVRVAFRSRDGKTARRTVTVRFKAPKPAGRRAAAEGR